MSTAPSPFDPVAIGPLRLRNRFIKAGANEAMCLDGAPTRALVQHHRDLAAGGVALTTVAYVAVSEVGRTLPNQIWMRPEILPDLRVLTGAVHGEGGAISPMRPSFALMAKSGSAIPARTMPTRSQ